MKKLLIFVCASVAILCSSSVFASDYPVEINKRPLTLPAGTWSAGANLNANSGFDVLSLGLTGNYAVNDEIQVNVGYGMTLKEFALGEGLSLGMNYGMINDGPLRVAPSVTFPLNFGDGDTLSVINIGADSRFNLMDDRLALFFGHNLIGIGIGGGSSYTIQLPVGVGYQVTSQINVRLDLLLATLAEGANLTIADVTPVTLTGVYSLNNTMDVGVQANMNAQAIGDSLALNVMFAYRGL